MGAAPSVLRTSFREKVWGSLHLAPWFPVPDRKIGEVWYESEEPLPLLVKLLFTSERLSVQVHPGDEYAALHEGSRGKTEMWYVLRADNAAPGVAVGLREPVSRERLGELARSGEIESFLNWMPVKPGDVVFVPAGTIHAIGPGLALCEIQQHSDVTYRLYDWGRSRELHIGKALDVAMTGPYRAPASFPGFVAHCPYFAVQEIRGTAAVEIEPKQDRFELLVALQGAGAIDDRPFQCGEVWRVPPGARRLSITPHRGEARFLRVFVP